LVVYLCVKESKKKMKKFETIYERLWDNPINKDGSKKEAKILGEFEIIAYICCYKQ